MNERAPINRDSFRVFMALCQYLDINGYAPTQTELKRMAEINSSVVGHSLELLEDGGYIRLDRTKSGQIREKSARLIYYPCEASLDFDPNEALSRDG